MRECYYCGRTFDPWAAGEGAVIETSGKIRCGRCCRVGGLLAEVVNPPEQGMQTDGSYIDRRGRRVSAEAIALYQSEDGHWRTYCDQLQRLAVAYRDNGQIKSAEATEADRQDILDILNS